MTLRTYLNSLVDLYGTSCNKSYKNTCFFLAGSQLHEYSFARSAVLIKE